MPGAALPRVVGGLFEEKRLRLRLNVHEGPIPEGQCQVHARQAAPTGTAPRVDQAGPGKGSNSRLAGDREVWGRAGGAGMGSGVGARGRGLSQCPGKPLQEAKPHWRLSVVSGPAPTAACGHLLRTQTGGPECPAKPGRKCAKSTRPGAAPTWGLLGSLHTESASSKAQPEWQQSVRAF